MKKFRILLLLMPVIVRLSAQERMLPAIEQQEPHYTSTTLFLPIGNSRIPVRIEQYGQPNGLVFINLHDNEKTSLDAARKLLEKENGLLIKLENRGKREIRFRYSKQLYSIDPNRIFSESGITTFLQERGRYNAGAAREIKKFGEKLLRLLPPNPVCVIALHNNTNHYFSIKDYLPGSNRARDAAEVHVNSEEDPDDLFITTDRILFHHLSMKNYNTVLQDNERCRQDGSLSVYCGNNTIRYVNLETEHGRFSQYHEMLNYLHDVLTTKNLAALEYFFSGEPDSLAVLPEKNSALYFGAMQVGKIQSAWLNEQTWMINGMLEVNPDFPLYNNMRIYRLTDHGGMYRFEIRADPAIERTKLNPSKKEVTLLMKAPDE